jgi:glycosyltransferase involved in cell wall biosynthesis
MISAYPPQGGGVSVHAKGLVDKLSKDHKTFLITYGKLGRKDSENVEIFEVPVIDFKFLRGLSFFIGAFFRLRRILKKEKVDVIHSQYMHPPGTVGWLYRKLSGKKKFIVTAHGSDLLSLAKGRFTRHVLKCVGKSCDRLICVSEHLAGKAQELGIGKGKIDVIYNGLDDKEFPKGSRESLRKELKLPGNKIVTFSGSLTEAKGADIFLILAKHFSGRKGDTRFFVVGDGPARKDLEYFCKKKGITSSVTFAGEKSHQEALKYMKASDVVVVPSRIEGFGLTALEAMRMGVPVVATPNGALPEIMPEISVTDNLPHTVMKVLEKKAFRDDVMRQNRKASARFTLEKMCDETEKLYRKARVSS